jgi:hypothetical protein
MLGSCLDRCSHYDVEIARAMERIPGALAKDNRRYQSLAGA